MESKELVKKSVELPELNFKNLNEFKALFENVKGNKGYIKTPYKEVEVNMNYAYKHFYENTYNSNRNNIKSGFFATFKEPLIVARKIKDDKERVYFYKPFLDKQGKILNIFGIGIDKNGKIDFKTYYDDKSGSRMKELLKDMEIVYKQS